MDLLFEAIAEAGYTITHFLTTKLPYLLVGFLLGFSPTIYTYLVHHLSIHWK